MWPEHGERPLQDYSQVDQSISRWTDDGDDDDDGAVFSR
jgi:hypothetical protein